jgi:hypothetical protein
VTLAALLALGLAAGVTRAQDRVAMPTDSLPAALRDGTPGAFGNDSRWRDDQRMRVRLSPSSARIGQAITYRGSVLTWRGGKVRFVPPRSDATTTWSQVRAGRVTPNWWRATTNNMDSVWFEARLQVFDAGRFDIRGPEIQLDRMLGGRVQPGTAQLPSVRVTILPTLTPADSNAELRGLHGPLRAPWWERIGWVPIVVGLLLLTAAIVVIRRLRRKKPVPVAPPAMTPAPVRARLDPVAEALRALAALRTRELPQAGRFREHAFELTAILRRFLEATVTTPRPGDTSGELLERLRSARMPEDDYDRLEGLLSLWDRVKFARAPLTEAEAARCEEAVEAFVRRIGQARAAAAARTSPPASGTSAPPAPPAVSRTAHAPGAGGGVSAATRRR